MKIKSGFEMVEIMNDWIVVPIGENMMKVEGLFALSESSAFLWKQLNEENSYDNLVSLFLTEYEIDRSTAELDVKDFLEGLNKIGILDDFVDVH
ncbi:MAG: Coenzyme synthesis protein (PqqD) [Firmicutes bacterium]|nr:Coenzyme synthesis protein (PqqD) [Bacillota bacterium]